MTKPEANKMLRKIYRFLKKNDVVFDLKRDINDFDHIYKGGAGYDYLVELNATKCGRSFLRTVIHTCLHLAEWNAPEKQILKWETEMFEQLSDRQLSNLMRRLYGSG